MSLHLTKPATPDRLTAALDWTVIAFNEVTAGFMDRTLVFRRVTHIIEAYLFIRCLQPCITTLQQEDLLTYKSRTDPTLMRVYRFTQIPISNMKVCRIPRYMIAGAPGSFLQWIPEVEAEVELESLMPISLLTSGKDPSVAQENIVRGRLADEERMRGQSIIRKMFLSSVVIHFIYRYTFLPVKAIKALALFEIVVTFSKCPGNDKNNLKDPIRVA